MSLSRLCSRNACRRPAVATLTYVYAESTAVVGPLATYAEPHTYDLCADHAEGLTAPRGWEIVRLPGEYVEAAPTTDDLLALADAVREAARTRPAATPSGPVGLAAPPARPVADHNPAGTRAPLSGARRGHLRVISTDEI